MNLCKTLINNEIESYSWDFFILLKSPTNKSYLLFRELPYSAYLKTKKVLKID